MTLLLRPHRQSVVQTRAQRARAQLVRDQAAMRRQAEAYDKRQAERRGEHAKEPHHG